MCVQKERKGKKRKGKKEKLHPMTAEAEEHACGLSKFDGRRSIDLVMDDT
jgi:hypothetical protein